MKNTLAWLTLILLLGVSVYLGFTYLKQRPPQALIELVTKTDPPPSLPSGDSAPLIAPEGFSATIFSREVPGARVMLRDPKGTMLVSLTTSGKVVALPDIDKNGVADKTHTVLEGLKQPHGILIKCSSLASSSASLDGCALYVAETGALKMYDYDADTMTATNEQMLLELPSGSGHYTRTLLMHPDNKRILISVGSSCNVCTESDERRATVLAYNIETRESTIFATGLRNTVFMAREPEANKIWGTDNGRDILGDDIPPDEVNIIEEGSNYGWPLCYGDKVHDTDFDNSTDHTICANTTSPHISLQAHTAPLGLAFIPVDGWPEDFHRDILVAYHGSWNRSVPSGYKVVRFDLDERRNVTGGPIDFLTGFLANGADTDTALGRPVDILTEAGGIAYISDDRAGAIYRIARNTAQ